MLAGFDSIFDGGAMFGATSRSELAPESEDATFAALSWVQLGPLFPPASMGTCTRNLVSCNQNSLVWQNNYNYADANATVTCTLTPPSALGQAYTMEITGTINVTTKFTVTATQSGPSVTVCRIISNPGISPFTNWTYVDAYGDITNGSFQRTNPGVSFQPLIMDSNFCSNATAYMYPNRAGNVTITNKSATPLVMLIGPDNEVSSMFIASTGQDRQAVLIALPVGTYNVGRVIKTDLVLQVLDYDSSIGMFQPAPTADTIGSLYNPSDYGQSVQAVDKAVTYDYGNSCFWIEEDDRSRGIRVNPATTGILPGPGTRVTVAGTLGNSCSKPAINNATFTVDRLRRHSRSVVCHRWRPQLANRSGLHWSLHENSGKGERYSRLSGWQVRHHPGRRHCCFGRYIRQTFADSPVFGGRYRRY